MMWAMTMIGRRCLAVATLIVCAGGIAAQQAAPPVQLTLPLDLTPPADTGKPHEGECLASELPGRDARDGAVELNATLFKW